MYEFESTAKKKDRAEDEFNLYKRIQTAADSINPENYPPKKVNEMVIQLKENFSDELFYELLAVMFRIHGVELRIKETVEGGNKAYLSNDDYFQVYSSVLWECAIKYTPFTKENKPQNFDNYFIRTFHFTFLEQKKNSNLRVHGHVPRKERKVVKIKSINKFSDTLGISTPSGYENKEMEKEVRRVVDLLLNDEEKQVITLMFFRKKRLTEEEVAFLMYNDVEQKNKVHYIKKNAFRKIKRFYPTLMEDYYYEREETIVDTIPKDEFFDDAA